MGDTGPEIHGLSGAYAVDALDELERARFEQHLASCSTCVEEVASLQEAAGALTTAIAVEPPAALRDRVLVGIGSVRPLPPLPRHDDADDSTPQTAAPAGAAATSAGPAGADRSARVLRLFPLLVAAALVLALGVGAAVWRPWSGEPASRMTAADRVLAADDAQRFEVPTDDGSRVEVVRSVSQDRAVIVADDMPEAPTGKVYQLWLQIDGEMVDAGLMPPGSDHTVLFDGDADSATGAGVTVEPAGGSEHPTSDPVVLVDFAQA